MGQEIGKVDIAELRRLHEAATTGKWFAFRLSVASASLLVGDIVCQPPDEDCEESLKQWPHNADYISAVRNALPALLDELEAAREEVRRLKQDLDGFKPVNGDFIKAAKAIGAAEELERSAKTLREDLADMNPPEFASRGKVAPGYCECLQDVADGMEERAAQLRREAEANG